MRIEKLFESLNNDNVKYLLIGGLASIIYGVPRTSIDVDITISVVGKNLERTIRVMKANGLNCDTEDIEDILAQGGITFSNDLEIDVLASLPGKTYFNDLWKRKKIVEYHGVNINVISKGDHIALLKSVGRKQDLEDLKSLENE